MSKARDEYEALDEAGRDAWRQAMSVQSIDEAFLEGDLTQRLLAAIGWLMPMDERAG